YAQTLRWGPCAPRLAIVSGAAASLARARKAVAGIQCAKLTVPLDYARPGGKTIKLAMNRLPASDPAQRIGSLLTNPGGPGVSGLQVVFTGRDPVRGFTARLRAHYDIVGMDPRGVGLSRPVRCEFTAAQDQQLERNPAPLVQARVTARACARTSGGLLPFVGTENAARDLDIARAVLGEPRLDYLGYSYGTLLGQVYAKMFPAAVGRMVLDSVLSPSHGTNPVTQAVSFERTFEFMVQTCIARGNCPMGSSRGGVLASFRRLLRRLESPSPPAGSNGKPLTADKVLGLVQSALYNEANWPGLEKILGALFKGAHLELPGGQLPGFSELSYFAIHCLTIPKRLRTVATAVQAGRAARAAAPHFGNEVLPLWLTCARWRAPSPPGAGRLIHAPGTPTILLVTNTVDPATPLAWAREVHAALANSLLVTNVAGGHIFYRMGPCTDRVVDDFLISDTRPAPGTVCHNRNPALFGPAAAPSVPVTG
ncbi:MAG: alpha/beta fold hydrolase, partial [Actinobacteria bacterium]|nr:alpha/beta fold hydrolase [Actinomycetota bacterium]